MSNVNFYDHALKAITPLRVLILGHRGAGKTEFFKRLNLIEPRLVGGDAEDIKHRSDCNVCIGLPDGFNLEQGRELVEQATHTLWVDSGDRVELGENDMCLIPADPHRMVMVDNSGTSYNLSQEVDFCLGMLGILPDGEE